MKWSSELLTERLSKLRPEFDYSKLVFTRTKDKVEIICSKHGSYYITPENALKGKGCNKCKLRKRRKDKKHYIKKALDKHGDKYDYSLIEKVEDSNEKVPIVCSIHGVFYQNISQHCTGQGCSKCAKEYLKQIFRNYKGNALYGVKRSDWLSIQKGRLATLYLCLLYNHSESFLKVGITYRDIKERFKDIPYLYQVLYIVSSTDAGFIFDTERSIKKYYKSNAFTPNSKFKGYTECLSSNVYYDIINFI